MKQFKKAGLFLLSGALITGMALTGCAKTDGQSSSGSSVAQNSSVSSSTGSSSALQSSSASGDDVMKVAFVYEGPIGDYGYNYVQDQGRKYLEQHLKNVKTTFVQNVPETADCEKVFAQLAEQGNKVIFGTTYGYMDYMVDVAKKYPNVIFEHCSGYKTASNLGTYYNRDYQSRYLTGMTAAKYTKSNTLGFLAPFGIPEVIRNIDAFTLGAQSVNPNIKVKVVWTNAWNDPTTEKTAANSLIDAGADVLAMHLDSAAFAQAAQSRGVYSVGYNTDMQKFAPKSILVSSIANWGPYFVRVVKSVQDKTWKPEQYWGGIADNSVIDISNFNDSIVSKDFQKTVLAKRDDIVKGTFDPFTGPIYAQNGQLQVAKGEKLSDAKLLSINWFVKGVVGTIPKAQ